MVCCVAIAANTPPCAQPLPAGMLCCASVNMVLYHLIWRKAAIPRLHAARMGPYGTAGGTLLLASIACGMLADQYQTPGFPTAKLVSKLSLFVSGVWGVLLFRELRSGLQVLFWLCCLQMMAACAVIRTAVAVMC